MIALSMSILIGAAKLFLNLLGGSKGSGETLVPRWFGSGFDSGCGIFVFVGQVEYLLRLIGSNRSVSLEWAVLALLLCVQMPFKLEFNWCYLRYTPYLVLCQDIIVTFQLIRHNTPFVGSLALGPIVNYVGTLTLQH